MAKSTYAAKTEQVTNYLTPLNAIALNILFFNWSHLCSFSLYCKLRYGFTSSPEPFPKKMGGKGKSLGTRLVWLSNAGVLITYQAEWSYHWKDLFLLQQGLLILRLMFQLCYQTLFLLFPCSVELLKHIQSSQENM